MYCIDVATDKPSRQVGWLKAWSLDLPLQPPTHSFSLYLFYSITNFTILQAWNREKKSTLFLHLNDHKLAYYLILL